MTDNEIAKIFKALADEKRVAIIKLLQGGELCACDIGEALNLSQSKLSYHMKIICESGIVTCRNAGKWSFYCINKQGVKYAAGILENFLELKERNESSCKK